MGIYVKISFISTFSHFFLVFMQDYQMRWFYSSFEHNKTISWWKISSVDNEKIYLWES